jgi:hypothetical protein
MLTEVSIVTSAPPRNLDHREQRTGEVAATRIATRLLDRNRRRLVVKHA